MRDEIDRLLDARGGAISRAEALAVVSRNQLDDEVARGHLASPFPRAYCRPWNADHRPVLHRAALASVGRPVALSHVSALEAYGLPTAATDRVHVTVPARRHPDALARGMIVHRTRVTTRVRTVAGLHVVEPAAAIVRSWPLLPVVDRRGPAVDAVRRRLVTPGRLHAVSEAAIGLPGRAELRAMIELLAAGCESELEIWGFLAVFDVPGLRHGMRQYDIHVGGQRYRLDIGYLDERVAIEMDGERFHADAERREADRRRDAALAAAGWVTLRFSWRRLHYDIDGCRRDTLATLASRRGPEH